MSALIFGAGIAGVLIGVYYRDWFMVIAGAVVLAIPLVAFVTSIKEASRTASLEADQKSRAAKAKADLIEQFLEQQEKKGSSHE